MFLLLVLVLPMVVFKYISCVYSRAFGTKYNATNYGIVLIGFGIGAVASSVIAGIYKDIAKDDINLMFPAFVIASLAAAVAIIMVFFIKPVNNKS